MKTFDETLELAQKIVRGSFVNFDFNSKDAFLELSSIYRFTNEDVTSYFHHLQDKRSVLSVIGSGNQILNSILAGTRDIDCFDISIFPEYYLYLQIASVLALSKEDYINYYLSDDRDILFCDDIYDVIRNRLSGNYKTFWDTLYMFDDGIDIYESLLFRHDCCFRNVVIDNNPFLQDDNYERLKQILEREPIKIKPRVMDILNSRISRNYDLVNLSNILSYHFSMDDYVDYFDSSFHQDSEIISYFYEMSDDNVSKFNDVLGIHGHIEEIGKHKLLVYKKDN